MATVVFRVQTCDGMGLTRPVTVSRRPSPQLMGAVWISASEISVTPDSQGMVGLRLAPGWYQLLTAWDRPVEFTVPDDEATHTLDELVGPGVRLAPAIGTPATPGFAFRQGRLWLTDLTGGAGYSIELGPPPGYPFQMVAGAKDATGAPTARLLEGALQFRDPTDQWHTVWIGGSALAPQLRVGNDGVVPGQRVRWTVTQLQLPNLDAVDPVSGRPSFHALLLVGTPSGLSLAFGPNLPSL